MTLATRTIQGNNSGPMPRRPRVVIMHSTRSTIATKTDAEELTSTLNWFTNPNGASSHWVLSATERVRVVTDDLIAWHAAYLNTKSWGVELTQPTIDRPFSAGHYANAALIGRHYVSLGVHPVWLRYWDGNLNESGFVAHEDTVQGRESGKTDPGPQFDRLRFIDSLLEEDEMTPQEFKALLLADADFKAVLTKLSQVDRNANEARSAINTHANDTAPHGAGYTDAQAIGAVRAKLT